MKHLKTCVIAALVLLTCTTTVFAFSAYGRRGHCGESGVCCVDADRNACVSVHASPCENDGKLCGEEVCGTADCRDGELHREDCETACDSEGSCGVSAACPQSGHHGNTRCMDRTHHAGGHHSRCGR